MRGFPYWFFMLSLLAYLMGGCGNHRSPPDTPQAGAEGTIETYAIDAAVADSTELVELRRQMVRRQIEARGVTDTAVLRSMRTVPRHRFVPEAPPAAAYTDSPLLIGHGQTISQPYMVAFMAQAAAVEPEDRVLEIGTGSGYGAAVLAELAREVYTIEIVPELAERARMTLGALDYDNVHVRTGNGWLGWPEHAPYDAIVVTAAPPEVPAALREQLALGGTMVIPVGDRFQTLQVLQKTDDGLKEIATMRVRFVPMVGEPPDTASGFDPGTVPDSITPPRVGAVKKEAF